MPIVSYGPRAKMSWKGSKKPGSNRVKSQKEMSEHFDIIIVFFRKD